MRSILSAFLLAALVAMPAWAGVSGDRPDLEDVYSWFYSETADYAGNFLTVYQDENQNRAEGAVGNYTDVGVAVFWDIYEPDKVMRSDKFAKLNQGAYLLVGFSTWNSTTWSSASQVVEDCKASSNVTFKDGDTTGAKWKMACNGALAALGLSPGDLARLDATLSRFVNTGKDKIKISGKVKFSPE